MRPGKYDMVFATISIVFGITILVLIPAQILEVKGIDSVGISPTTFPKLSAYFFLLLGILPIARFFIGKRQLPSVEGSGDKLPFGKKLQVSVIFGFILLYAVSLVNIGFLISTALFLLVSMSYIGFGKKLRIFIPVVILVPLVLYVFFEKIVKVNLP